MTADQLCAVGYTLKPKSLKGAIKVFFEAFFVDYLQEHNIDHLFVEKNGQFIPYFIEHISKVHQNGTVLIQFEGVNTKEAAQQIRSCKLYFKESELIDAGIDAEAAEEEEDWAYLVNYQVFNEDKIALGVIEGIVYFPKHELAQITYENKEVLLPLHEDLILFIDEEQKHIVLEVPEGLLEL